MKEMIKKMREEKDGFTIAELLIVVAIVAVLVAIAIPVFTSSLDESRYATDEANARSIYAEMRADYLTNGGNGQSSGFTVSPQAVTAGTATPVTVTYADGTTSTYQFNGITGITITPGTANVPPTVAMATWNGHPAQTFGGAAPAQGGDGN